MTCLLCTQRISLVSSFGATLLLGDYAAIDYSDGELNYTNPHTVMFKVIGSRAGKAGMALP